MIKATNYAGPSKCLCDGAYYDRWHRWAVLDRGEKSLLYCKACRGQWRSSARYAALLPDHTPRSRRGLTDDDVLSLIESGELRVICNLAQVWRYGRQLQVIEREHPEGPQRGSYRFVNVCHSGKKKKVSLHRIIWMAAHGRTVLDGFDIDHIESQADDTIGNLRLLPSSVNRSLGQAKATQAEVPF